MEVIKKQVEEIKKLNEQVRNLTWERNQYKGKVKEMKSIIGEFFWSCNSYQVEFPEKMWREVDDLENLIKDEDEQQRKIKLHN